MTYLSICIICYIAVALIKRTSIKNEWLPAISCGLGAALSLIAKNSYSEKYGARNMRRYMEKHLEDPLADQIIRQYDIGVTSATVDAQDGEITILCRA